MPFPGETMSRLAGKVAFVTGAGGGIGRAICERFLAEGAHVAAADIDIDAARQSVVGAPDEGRAVVVPCDVGAADSVREAIAHTVATFGALNVLCNVAGGSSANDGGVTGALEEEFWRVIRVDLFGTFVCCKYGIPELIRAGGGSVINTSSMAALMAIPGRDCYTAAKGGVAALTRSMAAGYAEHAVRVNAIAPGTTLSPRVRAVADSGVMKEMEARHLLGFVEPIDIAHMAVYLASDEARIVTGQIFSVDSGVTIH
jgi:NAD(P)-dependent dehydrogenase (short-subunit alcohol dehydrogenase family)